MGKTSKELLKWDNLRWGNEKVRRKKGGVWVGRESFNKS